MIFRYQGTSPGVSTAGVLYDEFVPADDTAGQATYQDRAEGQSWDSGSSPSVVLGVRFRLRRVQQMYGLMRASIYAHTGTYGTSSSWTGPPLVSSSWFAMDSVSSSATDYFFPLAGWTPTANTKYVAVLEFDEFYPDLTNYLVIVLDSDAEATHGGNIAYQVDSTANITPDTTADLAFGVYYTSLGGGGSDDNEAIAFTSRRFSFGFHVIALLLTSLF